ncbi:hypothetical protein QZM91_23700 [Burkholderia multivorans]|uniref:hypothetical protein n=1 Tax=Burkholderia multivorans TaxID=87883 RepID=UPI001E5694A9|nr:hypothetical protein [Burkholderia multivorans]MCA8386076.1 hypothetical protein [Burkholderia multivorans]MDN7846617.1 hypothetical protein [Burkholderia multivorans]MDN7970558.1 hypothetical protein [Burkholderia multivorans]
MTERADCPHFRRNPVASGTATGYKFRIDFFDEPNLRHVRQVLLLLFLVSQTAGGSRGLMAREAQPKFPKKPPANPAVFFRPSPAVVATAALQPERHTAPPESTNLPHAH